MRNGLEVGRGYDNTRPVMILCVTILMQFRVRQTPVLASIICSPSRPSIFVCNGPKFASCALRRESYYHRNAAISLKLQRKRKF